jgi:DNA repair exonuclease SbcCD nuclease subunit
MIAGNHDPYVADSWYRLWPWPSNVVVLSEDRPGIFLEAQKTFIYGLGFSARKQGKPDLNKVPKPKEGCFNILMLHGTVDMDVGDQDYSPVSSEELADLGYDYYALGHFHTRKSYPTLKNAFNPGSPEPLGFDEPGIMAFCGLKPITLPGEGITFGLRISLPLPGDIPDEPGHFRCCKLR